MSDPAPVAARHHIATHTTPTRIIPRAPRFEVAVHGAVGIAILILVIALISGSVR